MTQEEFFHASLKLVGIGCAIVGFDICATTVAMFAAVGFQNLAMISMNPMAIAGLSRPVAYLGAAFFLILKTDWCEKQFRLNKTPTQ